MAFTEVILRIQFKQGYQTGFILFWTFATILYSFGGIMLAMTGKKIVVRQKKQTCILQAAFLKVCYIRLTTINRALC